MHERNIAQPRMPICRVIKISDHTKCWSGENPHCWAAVSRTPEFGPEFHDITMQERGAMSDRWRCRQVLHDVTSSVVCNSLFVTSRNSNLNSGALETAEQSKVMQRYHEFCLKSALKLLILGWVVVYDKYKTALVFDPRHRIALVDFLRPECLSRPEKINLCDPVTQIRHSCGFLIWLHLWVR
jgi:hypothetical protein